MPSSVQRGSEAVYLSFHIALNFRISLLWVAWQISFSWGKKMNTTRDIRQRFDAAHASSKKNYTLRVLVFSIFLAVTVVPGAANAQFFGTTGSDYIFENTTILVGPGFGDPWNKYGWSMKYWNEWLYVGTNNAHFDLSNLGALPPIDLVNPFTIFQFLNSQARGAEIWRYNPVIKVWKEVTPSEVDSGGFRKMEVFDGKLFVSSSPTKNNFSGGAELYCTVDGRNWNKLAGGPMDSNNWSFRALQAFDQKLYVGSDNFTGGELWSWDGSDWHLVGKFPGTQGISELAVLGDFLYIGTQVGGFSGIPPAFGVYRMNAQAQLTDITPMGQELVDLDNIGVAKLFSFQNDLYMGTANFVQGFTLMRYSPDTEEWEGISYDGFGDDRNTYTWSAAVWLGKIFLGTFNSSFVEGVDVTGAESIDLLDALTHLGTAQLWCSDDGTNWKQVALPTEAGWGIWDYGIRNMEVADGKLFLSTASNLFAPDADELVEYVLEGTLPFPLPQSALIGRSLDRVIGPGTEIWSVRRNPLSRLWLY